MSGFHLRTYTIKVVIAVVTAAVLCIGLFSSGLVSDAIPRSVLFGN
jgi:hypothetical protein